MDVVSIDPEMYESIEDISVANGGSCMLYEYGPFIPYPVVNTNTNT